MNDSVDKQEKLGSETPTRRKRVLGAPNATQGEDDKKSTPPQTESSKPARTRKLVPGANSTTQKTNDEKIVETPAKENSEPKRTRTLSGANATGLQGGKGSESQPKLRKRSIQGASRTSVELPSGRPPEAKKPQIGDSRPPGEDKAKVKQGVASSEDSQPKKKRRRGGRGRGVASSREGLNKLEPVQAIISDTPVELNDKEMERRRGKERNGKPIGRYQMCVQVTDGVTHIAVLEGRTLIEHYVSRPSDDATQIYGNVYLGKIQNVLPGMEAAFVDIDTPKNAVLYRADVTYDLDDTDGDPSQPLPPKAKKMRGKFNARKNEPRIEQLLKSQQAILCQVTKNPIAHKGARLSTEISLPGRFVVLIPNSSTYGISKRLPDNERKRLRNILDKVKPKEHGVIVRTASEGVTAEEIERDVKRLLEQWEQISELAQKSKAPNLLFREPELAVRIIREEFNRDFRGVVIDDLNLFNQVKGYMDTIAPALADRIEFYDSSKEPLPIFERYNVAEQLRKALDSKVWLPSGGSLIIEHTEALTVIDVNTGRNVGKYNLEETVFRNNLEAAEEIAKQLRLRDIGGIIVIDFIDMEIRKNRAEVVNSFEKALAREKTRTQVSHISDLGLIEMTRRRIGEGLLESVSDTCPSCDGSGVHLHDSILNV
jgi:ribonuclease E